MKMDYICVNDFAPRDGRLQVWFKKVDRKKSDGFVAIFDGQVYVIDVGLKLDGEMLRFLSRLYEKWLANVPEKEGLEEARLELHVIISHPHPDHMGSLCDIVSDSRFCVLELFAPMRSYRSKPGPDQLLKLAKYEEELCEIVPLLQQYHHKATNITRIPYGEIYPLCPAEGDVHLDLYPSPFDWSEDRESESEGFDYLVRTSDAHNPKYQECAELGWTNGILNGNSLWVKIQKGGQVVLITGDQRATDEMLGRMIHHYGTEHFRCDVLKLTHHGEANYPPELIRIAAPSVSVFTVPRHRITPETLELCEFISTAYCLGEGNLLVTLDGKSIEVKQYE